MKIATCIVLYTADGRYLLQKRNSAAVFFPNCWGLIGGAAESEESPAHCLSRECREETNWVPSGARLRFIQEEHCIEYVYSAILNVPISALQCGEGERLCLFTYEQTKLLNWSPYHRQVFEKVYFLLQREQNVPKKSVLFYTKILPPAVGGYVTAGRCFIDAFKDICNLTIVTDIPCDSTEHKDYEPANIIAPSECKRYEKKHFDLLFFNATYEKTETLVSLMDLCQNTWSFEHNPLLVNYRLEMIKRFYVVDHLYVPSPFLKNDLQASTGSQFNIDILPIPIDPEEFYFAQRPPSKVWKIVSVCMIKRIRRIEVLLEVALYLKKKNICFEWDIVGDIPFQGDSSYYEELQRKIKEVDLSQEFHLVGISPHNKLRRIYHYYDVLIDFSLHETYGQAKLEAIFSGVHVLTPDIENNRNLFFSHRFLLSPRLQEFCEQVYARLVYWANNPTEFLREKYENWHFAYSQFSLPVVQNRIASLLYEKV